MPHEAIESFAIQPHNNESSRVESLIPEQLRSNAENLITLLTEYYNYMNIDGVVNAISIINTGSGEELQYADLKESDARLGLDVKSFVPSTYNQQYAKLTDEEIEASNLPQSAAGTIVYRGLLQPEYYIIRLDSNRTTYNDTWVMLSIIDGKVKYDFYDKDWLIDPIGSKIDNLENVLWSEHVSESTSVPDASTSAAYSKGTINPIALTNAITPTKTDLINFTDIPTKGGHGSGLTMDIVVDTGKTVSVFPNKPGYGYRIDDVIEIDILGTTIFTVSDVIASPTNVVKRILEEHDIDKTTDEYLGRISKEIAKGIPDAKNLDKNALYKKVVEYYNTRGSEASLESFFKIFFDEIASIFYPKDILFKPSDGIYQGTADESSTLEKYWYKKGFEDYRRIAFYQQGAYSQLNTATFFVDFKFGNGYRKDPTPPSGYTTNEIAAYKRTPLFSTTNMYYASNNELGMQAGINGGIHIAIDGSNNLSIAGRFGAYQNDFSVTYNNYVTGTNAFPFQETANLGRQRIRLAITVQTTISNGEMTTFDVVKIAMSNSGVTDNAPQNFSVSTNGDIDRNAHKMSLYPSMLGYCFNGASVGNYAEKSLNPDGELYFYQFAFYDRVCTDTELKNYVNNAAIPGLNKLIDIDFNNNGSTNFTNKGQNIIIASALKGFGNANSPLVETNFGLSSSGSSYPRKISWSGTKGFLSDVNKLHDSDYFQEFSYVIRTNLSVDRWDTDYNKLIHPSGLKFFTALYLELESRRAKDSDPLRINIADGVRVWLSSIQQTVAKGQHSPKWQPGWIEYFFSVLLEIVLFEKFSAFYKTTQPNWNNKKDIFYDHDSGLRIKQIGSDGSEAANNSSGFTLKGHANNAILTSINSLAYEDKYISLDGNGTGIKTGTTITKDCDVEISFKLDESGITGDGKYVAGTRWKGQDGYERELSIKQLHDTDAGQKQVSVLVTDNGATATDAQKADDTIFRVVGSQLDNFDRNVHGVTFTDTTVAQSNYVDLSTTITLSNTSGFDGTYTPFRLGQYRYVNGDDVYLIKKGNVIDKHPDAVDGTWHIVKFTKTEEEDAVGQPQAIMAGTDLGDGIYPNFNAFSVWFPNSSVSFSHENHGFRHAKEFRGHNVITFNPSTKSYRVAQYDTYDPTHREEQQTLLTYHLENITSDEIAIVYTWDASSCQLGNFNGQPKLREWLKGLGGLRYRNQTTTWSGNRTGQVIVYDKRHNRIFEKIQNKVGLGHQSTENKEAILPLLSLKYTNTSEVSHYPFIGTEKYSITKPKLEGKPVVIPHPTSGYQKLRISANGAVAEYINDEWVEHRSELEASDPKYLSKIDFTGYDWSPYVASLSDYSNTGNEHGGYDYDEVLGGLVVYGNSQWLEIPLDIPIDEEAEYNISLEIENLLPDKSNRVYAGVVGVDDAGQRLQTDLRMAYNYGLVSGDALTGGQSRTFTATFSGFNPLRNDTQVGTAPYSYSKYPVDQTGVSHKKFDPGATKFRLIIIGNYSPKTDDKVQGHVPSTLFKNIKIERADGKPVYNNIISKHDPNCGFNKIASDSLPVVPTSATNSNETYPNTFAVGTLVKDSKLAGVHTMDEAPSNTELLLANNKLPWRPGLNKMEASLNGGSGIWNKMSDVSGTNKNDSESFREFREGPFNDTEVVWVANNQDTSTNHDGGFISPSVPIDSHNNHRFTVFFKANKTYNGTLYFGLHAYNSGTKTSIRAHSSQNVTSNPYFFSVTPSTTLNVGEWYMAVGYLTGIHNSNGKINSSLYRRTTSDSNLSNTYTDAGLYSVTTGQKIKNAVEWSITPTTPVNELQIRSFQWSVTGAANSSEIEWARPRIDVLDENNEAPSLHTLLYGDLLPNELTRYPSKISVRDIYVSHEDKSKEVKYLITETDKVGYTFNRRTTEVATTETSTSYTNKTYNGAIEQLELNNTLVLGGKPAKVLNATTAKVMERAMGSNQKRRALLDSDDDHFLLTDGQFNITDSGGVDITSSFGSNMEIAWRQDISNHLDYGHIELLKPIIGFNEGDLIQIPNSELGNIAGLDNAKVRIKKVGKGKIVTEHNALASLTNDEPLYLTRDVKFSTNIPVNAGELGAYKSDDFRWETDKAYEISFNATKIDDKNIPANLFLSSGKIGKYFPLPRTGINSCIGNPNFDTLGNGSHGDGPHEFVFNSSLEGRCRIYAYIGDAEAAYHLAHNGHQLRVDDTNSDAISRVRTPIDYYKDDSTIIDSVADMNNTMNSINQRSDAYSLYVFESEFLSIGENIIQLYNRDTGDGLDGAGGFIKVEPLDNGLITEGQNVHKLYIPAAENDPRISIDHIVDRDQSRTGNNIDVNSAIADLERLYEYNWKFQNFKVREKRKRVYQGNFQCIVADAPDSGNTAGINTHPDFFTELYRPTDVSSIEATDGAIKYGGSLIVPALENRSLEEPNGVGQEYHTNVSAPILGVPKGKYGILKYTASASVLHYVSIGDEAGGFGIGQLYNPGEIYEVSGKIYIPSTNTKLEQIHVMAGINQRATDEDTGQFLYDDTGNPLFSNLSGNFQIMTGDLAGYDAYGTEPVVVNQKGNWISFTHKFIAPSVQQDARPVIRFVTTLKDSALRGYAGYSGDATGESFYIKDVIIKEGFDSDIVEGKDEIDERRETIIDLKDNVDYDISLNSIKANDEACIAIDIKHPADTNFYNVKYNQNTNLGDFDLNALPQRESNLLASDLPFQVGTGDSGNFISLGNPVSFNYGSDSPYRTTQENVQLEGTTPFGSTDVIWEARNKDGKWAQLNAVYRNGTGTTNGTGYTPGTYTNIELTDSPNGSFGEGVGAKATITIGGTGTVTSISITEGGVNYGKISANTFETANILVKIKDGEALTTSGTDFIGRANLVNGTINPVSDKVISFADGGFISPQVQVDTTKTYRLSVWVKASDVRYAAGTTPYDITDGGIKVVRWKGLNDSDVTLEAINVTSGDEANTPTFIDDFDFGLNSTTTSSPNGNPLNKNQWFLVVGHIRPFSHTGTTDHQDSGIYLPSTNPLKTRALPTDALRGDWKFNSATTKIQLTALQNANPLNEEHPVQFYAPRIDEINGLEPSIAELTSGKVKYKLQTDDYEKKIEIINWKTPILNVTDPIGDYNHIIEGNDFSVTIDEIKNGIEYADEVGGTLISTGSPNETLMEIEIPASGGTNTNKIILPLQKLDGVDGHAISIDWGDGTSKFVDNSRDRDIYHAYTETGQAQRFTIKISGIYHKLNVAAIDDSGPAAAITGVVTQAELDAARLNFKTHLKKFYLGDSALKQGGSTSNSLSFEGCTGLTEFISVKGISNTSNLTNLRNMFLGCSSLRYIDVRGLNTTNVTTLNGAFKNIGSGVTLIGFHSLNLSSLNRTVTGPEIDFSGTTFNSDELSRCYVSWVNNTFFTLPTGIEDATGVVGGVAITAKTAQLTFDRDGTASASDTFVVDGFRNGFTNTINDLSLGDVVTCGSSSWPTGTVTITNIDTGTGEITISATPTGNLGNNAVIKRVYSAGDTKISVQQITGNDGSNITSLETGMVVTASNAAFPSGTVTVTAVGQQAIQISSGLVSDIGNGKALTFKETTIRLASAPTGTIVNGMSVTGTGRSGGPFIVTDATDQQKPIVDKAVNPVVGNSLTFNATDTNDIKFDMGSTKYFVGETYDSPGDTTATNTVSNARTLLQQTLSSGGKEIELTDGGAETGSFDF